MRLGEATWNEVDVATRSMADEDGMVLGPDMDLSDQMTHMLAAQRAYQANVSAFERARDAYSRALEIGK